MKKTLLLLIYILGAVSVKAQDLFKQPDTATIATLGKLAVMSKTNLNFAVPDIPAFNILDNNPSTILRPSNPKAIALAFSKFLNENNKLVIPPSFAAEIAPGLFMKNYTLEDYRKKGINMIRFLVKARVSVGTTKDSTTQASKLAGGLRFTLIDKGDFRNDPNVIKAIFKLEEEYNRAVDSLKTKFRKEKNVPLLQFDPNSDEFIRYLQENLPDKEQATDQTIDQLIVEYKQTHWNATRLDVAYAVSASAADSLLANSSVNVHSFWLTQSVAINSKSGPIGQLLLGINDSYSRNVADDKFYNLFNLSVRFYAGSNRIKGYAEGEYKNDDFANENYLTANGGVEINPYDGIWFQFNAGIESEFSSGQNKIVSGLRILLSMPEKFKFN
ncbi:MAG TPA: hypothetical protein VE978_21370 [Chitinophagales bacterium]|nr:hypothetical protein [Chitinophagales bacterium]